MFMATNRYLILKLPLSKSGVHQAGLKCSCLNAESVYIGVESFLCL